MSFVPSRKVKVVIVLNTAWNLVNFRAGLIRAMVADGFDVVAVAPFDEFAGRLSELGCRFIALSMENQGINPVRDLLLLWRLYKLLQRERPTVFLGYTVKPNVYGSLAAHALGIPVINNISGLGAVFIKKNWLTLLVSQLYKLALSRSAKVFFQNKEDCQMFVDGDLVRKTVTDIVPGSGLNLSHFQPMSVTENSARFRFLLIARMLWDKGVGEYVEAARIIKRRGTSVEFCLLGFLDVQNPAAVSRTQMDQWHAEGLVTYLGVADDVRPFIAGADCIVLPSYREGTPRTLLEAAAMGKPIIATDAVGCREVVEDGVNGFMCKTRDAYDLSLKMEQMLNQSADDRAAMGRHGRDKVEREFDEQLVIEKYLATIHELAL